MKLLETFDTVQDRVKFLLEKYPEVRDNYKLLFLAYNCHFNNLKEVVSTGKYENFKAWFLRDETISADTISRARRKIQEDFPELSGEKEIRLQDEKKVRQYFAQE